MILYDYPKAPNPMRVNLFLYEKKMDIKRKIVDLSKHENLKPSLLKLNPFGTIPFLYVKGQLITESVAICKYIDSINPSPHLFGKSAIEKAKVIMYQRKVEYEGMLPAGEAFRNSSKAFKERAIAGPIKITQIPSLVDRGKKRIDIFFNFLNNTLKKTKYVAGNKFSIADIDAYVTLSFAKWIKIDGTEKRAYVKKWKDNLEARQAFRKYNNLFSK